MFDYQTALPDAEILYWDGHEPVAVAIEHYPDGMPRITHEPEYRITRVLLRPKSLDALLAAVMWITQVQVDRQLHLILPCVPGARQDRVNFGGGDLLLTVAFVAEMLEDLKADRVTMLDPHSLVAPALIAACCVEDAISLLVEEVGDIAYTGVISPDGGAEKRAQAVASALGLPLFHGWKKRDVTTGKLSGFGVEPLPEDGRFLVVDDICDGGGTFIGLAEEIYAQQSGRVARLDLFVTHGLFTQGTVALFEHYDHIYTTDSVISDKENVTVLHRCRQLLERE